MKENLNLEEILKDCPEGTELYSTIFGEVKLDYIENGSEYPINVKSKDGLSESFTSRGELFKNYDGECVLFPSKDQRDWSKFTASWYKKEMDTIARIEKQRDKDKLIQELGEYKVKYTQEVLEKYINSMSNKDDERLKKTAIAFLKDFAEQGYENALECIDWLEKQDEMHIWTIQDAKDGDVLACNEEILLFKSYSVQGRISLYCWYNGQTNNFHNKEVIDISLNKRNKICPATKEQRDLLFQKIKDAGYKWNAETKTLEKLVKPKFMVGDMIRHKETNKDDVYEIIKVYCDSYGIDGFPWLILMEYQDQYELVTNKFDPKTLKPLDSVLAKNDSSDY